MPTREYRRRFISVGTKLAVSTVLVLAVLSFLLFKELTQREQRKLVDAKAIAGSMVTDLFAASCAAPLVFADNDAVATELEKLRSNKSIVYAAVYSAKEDRTVGELNPVASRPYDFKHGKMRSRLVEGPDGIEILKDIRDTHDTVVGFAVLNFSLADENAMFQVSRRRMLWFAFLLAAGTASLLILFARKVIVKPLARVTEAARRLEEGDLHARADVRSNDEVGNLAMVFNSMGDAIVDREQKVIQAQKNVQDLFDNMLQAIFTVGPDGRINNEVSAFAKQIFGEAPIAGQPVTEFLRLESLGRSEAVSRMKFWLASIWETDDLQWDLSEPDRIRQLNYVRTNADGSTDERALELDYAPIYKDGAIVKIMFLVKDVTEVHRLQAEIARRDERNTENLARIKQIASMEPDLFNTFISEAYAVLDGCEQSLADLKDPTRRLTAVNCLFRGMHTLKGNARMFKLTAVQDIAHTAEDYFQKVRDGQVGLNGDIGVAMQERITEVRKLLGEFEKLGRQVLGGDVQRVLEGRIAALRDSLRGLRQAVVAHAHDDRQAILPPLCDLERAVVHLTTSSLGDVLAPVASTAKDLAIERGKQLEEVALENLDFFLDPRVMQKIRGAVVHAIRNAVDHGLEPSDARISAGKPPRGRISISARENDGWIDLAIEDDGPGVDTTRVKEIAVARGIIDATRAATLSTDETHELLFLPGFSTAGTVSSVSGRGVGMDAIRAVARELVGEVKLTSTLGRGSRLTIHFPSHPPAQAANPGKPAPEAKAS